MRILSAEIDMMEQWANDPVLKITVDRMPPSEEFIYTKIELTPRRAIYFAKHECGIARFMVHDQDNERGYAGRVFTITLDDGTQVSMKGPWSSRSGVMNNYFDHTTEVTIYERDGDHPSLGFASHIDVDIAREVLEGLDSELNLRAPRNENDGDIAYVIPKVTS